MSLFICGYGFKVVSVDPYKTVIVLSSSELVVTTEGKWAAVGK